MSDTEKYDDVVNAGEVKQDTKVLEDEETPKIGYGSTPTEPPRSVYGGKSQAAEEEELAGKLFVGGLSWQTTLDGLRFYFEKFGELQDAALMTGFFFFDFFRMLVSDMQIPN